MFRTTTTTTTEPVHEVADHPADDPIPLSHLALDLEAPAVGWDAGWDAFLASRNIPVVLDDLGRKAISRADARQLFDEQREAEARRRELAQRREQEAIEADRARRAQLPSGTPWWEIPVGVSAALVWVQAEKDAKPKRRSPLEDALAGEGTVYRPLPDES